MSTVAKVEYEKGRWLFGKIEDGFFVLPSGRKFKIDDDGFIDYYGQRLRVISGAHLE